MKVATTGFDVGYGGRVSFHTREIPKRPFGTPAKVLEEYEEYVDAREQGLRLIQLFELSDMLGALAGCFAGSSHNFLPWPSSMKLEDAVKAFVASPKEGEAEVLLTAILSAGETLGFSGQELLVQAQLRSAVLLASQVAL